MSARLFIHAHPCGVGGQGVLARWAGDLRAWWSGRAARPAASVRIDDLQGRNVFSAEDAQPLIALALPAGTYHVTLRCGALRRRYTVTLEQGSEVDLDLPPVAAA